jgi:hypothetical protein
MLNERGAQVAGEAFDKLDGASANGVETAESFSEGGAGAGGKSGLGGIDAAFAIESESFKASLADGIGVTDAAGRGLAQPVEKECLRNGEVLDDFDYGPAARSRLPQGGLRIDGGQSGVKGGFPFAKSVENLLLLDVHIVRLGAGGVKLITFPSVYFSSFSFWSARAISA